MPCDIDVMFFLIALLEIYAYRLRNSTITFPGVAHCCRQIQKQVHAFLGEPACVREPSGIPASPKRIRGLCDSAVQS